MKKVISLLIDLIYITLFDALYIYLLNFSSYFSSSFLLFFFVTCSFLSYAATKLCYSAASLPARILFVSEWIF
jgi:hypothetical protein